MSALLDCVQANLMSNPPKEAFFCFADRENCDRRIFQFCIRVVRT